MVHETGKLGADNPDNFYVSARGSGQHRYRVWGKRGTRQGARVIVAVRSGQPSPTATAQRWRLALCAALPNVPRWHAVTGPLNNFHTCLFLFMRRKHSAP